MEIKKILPIFLMLISSACLCIGSLIWKLMPNYNLFYLFGGFAVYFLGAGIMILAYRYGELSVLQPINSMSYVFAAILAYFILKEELPIINIIGITLIVSGVIVLGTNNR